MAISDIPPAEHSNDPWRARHRPDALTGLPTRSALADRLDRLEGDAATLVLFDLEGFKEYNDSFGHPAGDAMLVRFAGLLDAAAGADGSAYRMDGAEFAVLLEADADRDLVHAARDALCERGEGFDVSAAHGSVQAPSEAAGASAALRLADQRMRRNKRGQASAAEQASSALLRLLAERHAELGSHCDDVAGFAESVARRLGLDEESAREVRAAAELHDVGKAAVPDAILAKPSALNDEEWAFMRRHTLIGERIIASASSLHGVATLVRSSHERWDGGGYPDALAGVAIPLGSRIISVCDAYDAMITERPYAAAVAVQDALSELERCAGTQFDADVVAAFVEIIRIGLPVPVLPDGSSRGLLHEAIVAELENLEGVVLGDLVVLYFDEATNHVRNLAAAVRRGDAPAVALTAHALKGGSSTVGAMRVSGLAARLESDAAGGDIAGADALLERMNRALRDTARAYLLRPTPAYPFHPTPRDD